MLTGILIALACLGNPDSTKVKGKQTIQVYQQKKFEDTAKQYAKLDSLVNIVKKKRQSKKDQASK